MGLAVAAALGFPAAPAAGQQSTTSGSIAGRVTDPDGQPRANVIVRATDLERGAERQALTDAQGRYRFALLPPGSYTVRAEFPPLAPVQVSSIRVSIGERTTVDLTLQPVEAEELTVTVGRGGITDIDVSQGGVVELIDEEQISELPTAGRDFTDFIALSGLVSPQAVATVRQESGTGGQFSILGARTSTSNITIDGVDANNQFFGENRGSSRLPFTFSLESIKEFQIITSGYDVEYGRFAGGQINAVTKGGTNEFSGEGWFFGRDEAFTANNFDGTPAPGFQSFQFGGRLAGPLVKDKLHFFLSADLQQRDEPAFALDPTRANLSPGTIDEIASIMRDVYGFDQATLSNAFGIFDATDDQINVFGRLDWTISPKHRLTVRTNVSDFESLNDEISTGGRESRLGGATFESNVVSLMTELNSALGSNVFNTLRLQYAREKRPRTPNTGLPEIEIDEVPTLSGGETSVNIGGTGAGISFRNNLEEEKFQITDNLNFQLGDHTLKIGTDNVFTDIFNQFWLFGNGGFDFDNIEDFRNKKADFFLRAVPDLDNPFPPETNFDAAAYSAYIQDEWQASDKLRFLVGLRWDFQDFQDPGVALANPDFQDDLDAFGVSATNVPSDGDNIGPRFSFTYDTHGDGRELVRGGVGVFYDDIPIVTHGNVTTNNPDPLLFNVCIAAGAPDPSQLAQMGQNPDLIPNTCAPDFVDRDDGFAIGFNPFGIGIIGAPDVVVWDPDTQNPQTLRANLGYERRLGRRWKVGATGIFSRTWNLFRAQQITQRETPVFFQGDGRPVWVEERDFDPEDVSENDVTTADDVRFLFLQTDGADARAYSLDLDVQGAPTDNFRLGASWTINVSKDNSSKECCTAFALATEVPTAGNLNFLGDPGDEDVGSWGPSRNERRHVIVLNAIWRAPAGLQISGIYRGQAGLPFTPSVNGDLNGDGIDDNDRPFLPDPATASPGDPLNLDGLQFSSAADLDRYTALLAENKCLREAIGTIIHRNTCRDPWWHSVNLKIKKDFTAPGGHHFEFIADLFNVLDAFGIDAGEFTFKRSGLFTVPDEDDGNFDADEKEVIVRTRDFGQEIPAGFRPSQFQAQLGFRYRF
ncbi:MAG: carboxypeptidase regulatory-like domain-containing protein [Gemmatimonadota bacterium]